MRDLTRRRRRLSMILMLAVVMLAQLVFLAPAASAQEQPAPYQAPELISVDLPSWAAPFEPIAALPLWAQAALVSALIAGLIFIVPVVTRWLMRLGQDAERSAGGGE